MSTPQIEVLALVHKSMEMRLPMTVKLHEVAILRAVYGGQVEVLHYRETDEILDAVSEMDRLTKVYGSNKQQQPWAEAIFGAFGAGAVALDSLYSDEAEAVRADLLGNAEPFPDAPEAFEHPVSGATVVPNLGDVGTAQDPDKVAGKVAGKKPAAKKAAKKAAEQV